MRTRSSLWGVASLCLVAAACSSSPAGGPDGGDAGNPDVGGDGPSPETGTTDGGGGCTNPTSGTAAHFATNAVTLPTKKSDFAYDLDGDGKSENQFGAFIGALVSQGLTFQPAETSCVTSGHCVLLVEETSDDATGQSDSCAGARLWIANATASAPKFDGTDTFTADLESLPFQGAIGAGQFVSETPATMSAPVSATLRMALFDASTTIDIPIVGAELELKRSGTTSSGVVHGAMTADKIQSTFLPQFTSAVNAQIAAKASTSQALLQLFDTGGAADSACGSTCKNADNSCATAGDKIISDCEVSTNAFMKSALAPDVQLFDAQKNWHPTPGGTQPDSLSIGLGFSAVNATF